MAEAWIPVLSLGGYASLTAPFPRAKPLEAGAGPRAVLSSQVCVCCCCCCRSSRTARDPVSGRFPVRESGLSVQAVGGAKGQQVEARSGGAPGPRPPRRSWRVRRSERLPGTPHSYPQPMYSCLPISPMQGCPWGPIGSFFPVRREGSLPHPRPRPRSSPAPRAEQRQEKVGAAGIR